MTNPYEKMHTQREETLHSHLQSQADKIEKILQEKFEKYTTLYTFENNLVTYHLSKEEFKSLTASLPELSTYAQKNALILTLIDGELQLKLQNININV